MRRLLLLASLLLFFCISNGSAQQEQHKQYSPWRNDSTAVSIEHAPKVPDTTFTVDTTGLIRGHMTRFWLYQRVRIDSEHAIWLPLKNDTCRVRAVIGNGFMAIDSGTPQFYKVDHIMIDSTTTDSVHIYEFAVVNQKKAHCLLWIIGDKKETYVKIYLEDDGHEICVVYRMEEH